MADTFLQFSMSFPLKSSAEKSWCIATMTTFQRLLDETRATARRRAAHRLGALGQEALKQDWDFCTFDWCIAPGDRNARDRVAEMCLFANESGTPEQVAAFLQAYLNRFHPGEALWFSWAYTCSKMRVNEFGGGGAVVTAGAITFIDVQDWAQEQADLARATRPRLASLTA